jgi:hypothetical protein
MEQKRKRDEMLLTEDGELLDIVEVEQVWDEIIAEEQEKQKRKGFPEPPKFSFKALCIIGFCTAFSVTVVLTNIRVGPEPKTVDFFETAQMIVENTPLIIGLLIGISAGITVLAGVLSLFSSE